MILFPISTDVHDGTIRLAALQVIGICFLVHIFVAGDTHKVEKHINEEVSRYYSLKRMYRSANDTTLQDPAQLLEFASDRESVIRRATADVDSIIKHVSATSILHRYGFKPGRFSIVTLFTSMFLHASWMHLLGNMVFFYVCGIAMEKYWGYWRFLFIYLGCGIAATLTHLFTSSIGGSLNGGTPLVGASGAIAGAMGAFVVTHSRVQVKVFYMVMLWLRGTFHMRAVTYFGIWFLSQVTYTILTLNAESGVAYGAHVGGFVAGAFFGVVIKSEDSVVPKDPKTPPTRKAVLPDEAFGAPETPQERFESPEEKTASQIEKAWSDYRAGKLENAALVLIRQQDMYLQDPNTYHREAAGLMREMLTARDLPVPAPHLYQWAKTFASLRLTWVAVPCFDWAAEAAPTNSHVQKNSLLSGAVLRIAENADIEQARANLLTVIKIDSGGIFAQKAQEIVTRIET